MEVDDAVCQCHEHTAHGDSGVGTGPSAGGGELTGTVLQRRRMGLLVLLPLRREPMKPYSELERLVAAGAISETFRQQLLSDPQRALEMGYLGEPFHLTKEEMAFLREVRARDFQEFAQLVSTWVANQVRRNGHAQSWAPQTWGLHLVY